MKNETPRFELPEAIPLGGLSKNTTTYLIQVTEDKLLRILDKYRDKAIRSKSWELPCGIFFTLIITIFTADFKDFQYITSSSLNLIFSISAFISLVLMVKNFCANKSLPSVEDLVSEIKGENK
ncbi:hypothetical protein ACX1GI_09895 [Yersinia pseudotuberculosis]|uniref:hypothetical protein n=1 Tax=Yersinia TaxID=629 RepID=UPI000576A79E|nr:MULTISPECIES: hypothetical protein [Yersinia]AYW95470.1 hypothetical protein EGX39_06165 [Yersinia pseudotuberculosis]MDA5496271.1 hypothetical protein [Yersinia aleksiciae]NIL01192.1 hypothetical protein [Yersinia aleksiciae]WQC70665.1 hypothetical protein N0K21_18960 [Yersinia aleksiciae]